MAMWKSSTASLVSTTLTLRMVISFTLAAVLLISLQLLQSNALLWAGDTYCELVRQLVTAATALYPFDTEHRSSTHCYSMSVRDLPPVRAGLLN